MGGAFFLLAISRKRKRMQNHQKVKLSSSSMEGTLNKAISRKPKRKQKGIVDDLCNEENSSDDIGIDKLSDDILITILSRMSLNEAAMTSVLSRRWKYLWMFAFRTLEFNATGTVMKMNKFKTWVNTVLKFYQSRLMIDGLIIRLPKIGLISARTYRSWIYFAVQKEVQCFELNFTSPRVFEEFTNMEFPNMDMLLSVSSEIKSPFRSLRSLILVHVDIKDELVQYFLAACPHLEELRITWSDVTKNLQILDPPNLKVLKISKCFTIQSLELSSAKLFSFTYYGANIGTSFKNLPNLSELSLGQDFCDSFIFEPNQHSSYSVKLVKLVLKCISLRTDRATIPPPPDLPQLCSLKQLELQVSSVVGRSILFFTSLINASPHLLEFKIQMFYHVDISSMTKGFLPFPAISHEDIVKFDHKNLKTVEMVGFVGCSSEEMFLEQLLEIAPSIEVVIIDTESEYYDDPELAHLLAIIRKYEVKRIRLGRETGATTRTESREHAKHLISNFPPKIRSIVK